METVRLCGYRGFPEAQDIHLKGKSLVLYGENGSGKSSVGKAIRDLLTTGQHAPNFDDFVFRYGELNEEREVVIFFNREDILPLRWSPQGRDELHRDFSQLCRSRGWIDYRAVWRLTEVPSWTDCIEVFSFFAETLVTGCESPLIGTTFGDAWASIEKQAEKKPNRSGGHRRRLDKLWADIEKYNQALEAFLPELESSANAFLTSFAAWTRISLKWKGGAAYEPSRKRNSKLTFGRIEMRMHHRDDAVLKAPSELLNEARVTAIGLCLYLAGLSKSVPAKRGDGTEALRLLVLDDVLLSLDMAHRLPLLKILIEKFSSWQVLLLTHDRAWYEIASQQLNDWTHLELFTQQVGDYEQPLLRHDQDHLGWAIDFLVQGHVKAAAVHVRSKFEEVLKWACHSLGLAVKYHLDPRKITARDFWSAVSGATFDNIPPVKTATDAAGKPIWWQPKPATQHVVPPDLQSRIDHALSWVMNPLSHSQSVDRYRPEIEDAIFAVNDLETSIRQAIAMRQVGPVLLREMLLKILASRTRERQ
jgi:hypothetical protein